MIKTCNPSQVATFKKGKKLFAFQSEKKYSVHGVTELEICLLEGEDMRLQWIKKLCLIFSQLVPRHVNFLHMVLRESWPLEFLEACPQDRL